MPYFGSIPERFETIHIECAVSNLIIYKNVKLFYIVLFIYGNIINFNIDGRIHYFNIRYQKKERYENSLYSVTFY